MANIAIVSVGCLLLVIAVVGYVTPFNEGYTIPGTDAICSGDMGQLGQTFRAGIQQGCSEYKLATLGIYGVGIVGIIIIIVGAIVPSKSNKQKDSNSLEILKDRYAKGEITKEAFDKMKKDLE